MEGIKAVVKVRIYQLSKGISESLLYAGIGVEGGVNPPRGLRIRITCQTPSEAPSERTE
jgi:putative transposase